MLLTLCWHKSRVIEEVEVSRIDKDWLGAIAHADLDVLRIKDGKMYTLDSLGSWSRVQRRKDDDEGTS